MTRAERHERILNATPEERAFGLALVRLVLVARGYNDAGEPRQSDKDLLGVATDLAVFPLPEWYVSGLSYLEPLVRAAYTYGQAVYALADKDDKLLAAFIEETRRFAHREEVTGKINLDLN